MKKQSGIIFRLISKRLFYGVIKLNNGMLTEETSLSIRPSYGSGNCAAFYDRFKNEKYYTVTIPRIIVTYGISDGASVEQYGRKKGTAYTRVNPDISFCNETGGCEWTFQVPQSSGGNAELLFYAGIREKAEGIGVMYENVKL